MIKLKALLHYLRNKAFLCKNQSALCKYSYLIIISDFFNYIVVQKNACKQKNYRAACNINPRFNRIIYFKCFPQAVLKYKRIGIKIFIILSRYIKIFRIKIQRILSSHICQARQEKASMKRKPMLIQ